MGKKGEWKVMMSDSSFRMIRVRLFSKPSLQNVNIVNKALRNIRHVRVVSQQVDMTTDKHVRA